MTIYDEFYKKNEILVRLFAPKYSDIWANPHFSFKFTNSAVFFSVFVNKIPSNFFRFSQLLRWWEPRCRTDTPEHSFAWFVLFNEFSIFIQCLFTAHIQRKHRKKRTWIMEKWIGKNKSRRRTVPARNYCHERAAKTNRQRGAHRTPHACIRRFPHLVDVHVVRAVIKHRHVPT